jgi:hypothetical protein
MREMVVSEFTAEMQRALRAKRVMKGERRFTVTEQASQRLRSAYGRLPE